MALLFEVNDGAVVPTTEILAVEPFSTIWERDTSKDKSQAMFEFKYIEFMMSMKKTNPFAGYDPEKRHHAILENQVKLGGDITTAWVPDAKVQQALNWYEEFNTEASSTYTYLLSVREAAEKMKRWFRDFDPDERNPKTNALILKPADVTRAMKDTADVLKNLDTIEKQVQEELFESTRKKGDKEISPFAK